MWTKDAAVDAAATAVACYAIVALLFALRRIYTGACLQSAAGLPKGFCLLVSLQPLARTTWGGFNK